MPKSFSITDIGLRREMNQDYIYSSDLPLGSLSCLYLVADGMGGHRAGDLASKLTVEIVVNEVSAPDAKKDPEELLRDAFRTANTRIRETAARHIEYYGMGTTLVGCTICGDQVKGKGTAASTIIKTVSDRSRWTTPLWKKWSGPVRSTERWPGSIRKGM